MAVVCRSCRSEIALEDVNPSTDVALCRRCKATHSYAQLLAVSEVDVRLPPAGARFEGVAGGFTVEASTRSWMAALMIPFACAWIGMSAGAIYGRQIESRRFDPIQSLLGIPFLLGSIMLIVWCAMMTAGVVRVTRRADDLEIFIGIGPIGWRRRYRWSDFRTAREDTRSGSYWSRKPVHVIVLEGDRRAVFGSMLSEERRYFLLNVLRKMQAGG